MIVLIFLCISTTQANSIISVNVVSNGTIKYASPTNFAPFPNAWSTAYSGMSLAVGGVANVVIDNNVIYSGSPSIRIDPVGTTVNRDRECDGPRLTVHPGDHLIFKIYAKTSAIPSGETDRGIRIGIDFYNTKRIIGSNSPDGQTWTPQDGWPNNEDLNFVSWGTSNWTVIVMDFIVANQYPADNWSGYTVGTMVTPTSIIPWVQVCSSTDSGQAWFAASELYIIS